VPVIEQPEPRRIAVAGFVGEVIGPPRKGVDRRNGAAHPPRHQHRRHREILVVLARQLRAGGICAIDDIRKGCRT
jgi:hypothetical protein